eukprot:TRINITY_DN50180_c0_g1_i1.p1 TRINITY_DN50180_c0_g1~~TRINITY_DN50180_c0_g1_i1.p1  ORF type:complete len:784 (-),score=141.61 TRINITY_DN50180_c0_g1_i1:349-2700(-)
MSKQTSPRELPAPPPLRGALRLHRHEVASMPALQRYQVRFVAVDSAKLYWWASVDEAEDVGFDGCRGCADLVANACVVEAVENDLGKFSLRPLSGRWSGSAFAGAVDGRVLRFDASDSENDRAQWMAAVRAHASHGEVCRGLQRRDRSKGDAAAPSKLEESRALRKALCSSITAGLEALLAEESTPAAAFKADVQLTNGGLLRAIEHDVEALDDEPFSNTIDLGEQLRRTEGDPDPGGDGETSRPRPPLATKNGELDHRDGAAALDLTSGASNTRKAKPAPTAAASASSVSPEDGSAGDALDSKAELLDLRENVLFFADDPRVCHANGQGSAAVEGSTHGGCSPSPELQCASRVVPMARWPTLDDSGDDARDFPKVMVTQLTPTLTDGEVCKPASCVGGAFPLASVSTFAPSESPSPRQRHSVWAVSPTFDAASTLAGSEWSSPVPRGLNTPFAPSPTLSVASACAVEGGGGGGSTPKKLLTLPRSRQASRRSTDPGFLASGGFSQCPAGVVDVDGGSLTPTGRLSRSSRSPRHVTPEGSRHEAVESTLAALFHPSSSTAVGAPSVGPGVCSSCGRDDFGTAYPRSRCRCARRSSQQRAPSFGMSEEVRGFADEVSATQSGVQAEQGGDWQRGSPQKPKCRRASTGSSKPSSLMPRRSASTSQISQGMASVDPAAACGAAADLLEALLTPRSDASSGDRSRRSSAELSRSVRARAPGGSGGGADVGKRSVNGTKRASGDAKAFAASRTQRRPSSARPNQETMDCLVKPLEPINGGMPWLKDFK